jgi:membrane-associated phospholipid phosphatase
MKTKLILSLFLMISLGSSLAQNEFNIRQLRMEPTLSLSITNSQFRNGFINQSGFNDNFDNGTTFNLNESLIDSPKKKTVIIPVDTNYKAPEGLKTRLPQALIIPAILIGWGVSTIGSNGLYSSHQARTDLLNFTKGKGGPIDNYLIISPYFEFGALLLFKVKCNNDFVNTTLLIAKSEALMLLVLEPMKYITHEQRPDKSDYLSMPSGHTAEAFVAATIVYREYRYLSPWAGVGAYTLATTVGAFRMINDKHWESDVFVGAGIGMMSTNIIYATHQHRWGRNGVCLTPTYDGKNAGLAFTMSF